MLIRSEIIAEKVPLDLAKISDFCQRWHITEFALFGSVVRGDFRVDSDVDVLVTFAVDAATSLFDLATMQAELQLMFGHAVDLVSRRGIERSRNIARREEILHSAEVIYHAAA
ncbi:MAG: nucleotidyltransferase domain-containing protein [bacterium]